jgi:NTP pyrophosphatase (non-canonical NTP hydrolase)
MSLDLDRLASELRAFSAARDWDRFHNPKNLAMALTAEAGELLEQLQWLTPEEAVAHAPSEAVADEVADVLIYLVRFADVSGIDLEQAVTDKLRKNEVKHVVPEA